MSQQNGAAATDTAPPTTAAETAPRTSDAAGAAPDDVTVQPRTLSGARMLAPRQPGGRDLMASIDTRMTITDLGRCIAFSGMFDDAQRTSQAIVKILAGAELGLGPIASMTGFHIIDGKVSPGAHVISALIKAHPRYDYAVVEFTHEKCEISCTIDGKPAGPNIVFTMQDAQRAQLTHKTNWKQHPRQMLFARCVSIAETLYFPDVTSGIPVYTPDELGVEVDEYGAPINLNVGTTGFIDDMAPGYEADPAVPAAADVVETSGLETTGPDGGDPQTDEPEPEDAVEVDAPPTAAPADEPQDAEQGAAASEPDPEAGTAQETTATTGAAATQTPGDDAPQPESTDPAAGQTQPQPSDPAPEDSATSAADDKAAPHPDAEPVAAADTSAPATESQPPATQGQIDLSETGQPDATAHDEPTEPAATDEPKPNASATASEATDTPSNAAPAPPSSGEQATGAEATDGQRMVANEQADARPPAAPAERAALIKAYAQAGYDEDVVEQVGRIVCGALMDRLTSSQVGTLTNVLESFITIGTPAESLLAAIATFNERYTDERERSERFCKWLLHAEEQTVAGRTTNAPAQSPEQQQ